MPYVWKLSTVLTRHAWPSLRSSSVHTTQGSSGAYTKRPPVVTSMRLPPGSIPYRKKPCAIACLDGAASMWTSFSRKMSAARRHSSRVSTQ